MLKTVATLPFVAALLASNSIGLELVSNMEEEYDDPVGLETLYSSVHLQDISNGRQTDMSNIPTNCLDYTGTTRKQKRLAREPPSSQSKTIDDKGKDLKQWRPLFDSAQKAGDNVRRLHPHKSRGRAHLAPIDAGRVNALTHCRQSSESSAASLQGSPNTSPIHTRFSTLESSPFTQRAALPSISSLETLSSNINPRHRRCESEDITNGTLHRDGSRGYLPAQIMNGQQVLDRSRVDTLASQSGLGPPPPPLPKPTFHRSISESSQTSGRSVSRAAPAHKKGHARNESIASVWTVDSSPDSSGSVSPVCTKRRPLHLSLRPPLPNFDAEPRTAPIGKTFALSSRDENQPLSPNLARSPISSRSTTRHSSAQAFRPRAVTSCVQMPKMSAQASENWDDDFGELSLEVPVNVRQSQHTVRNHLWQFRQFSKSIADLTRLRERQSMMPSKELPAGHPVWDEVDAILAIASRGDDSMSSVSEIQYRGARDDTISRILGQFKKNGGRVRLNEKILSILIAKADGLLEEIESVTDAIPVGI